jgi:predicted transcriptional regulator
MKSSYLLLTLILASFVIKAQIVQDSIPKHYELNRPQYNAWNYIYQEWMTKEYGKILMENNLKMNCTTCVSVYMNAVITIDNLGKLKKYQVVKSKKCKETFTKKT